MRAKSALSVQAAKKARRDRIVLEHLPLVKAIAVRVHENLPVHVDLDDLVHAGVLGLFDAASKFNPEKQVAFSSYAKHRIKGAILDSLRQLDWASRDLRRRHKQVEAATRELSATLAAHAHRSRNRREAGRRCRALAQMMLDLRSVGLISASSRTAEHDDLPAPDFPSKPETQPDNMCSREQMRSVLGVAMKTLPERYQKVVVLYYTNEMTMKEIGGDPRHQRKPRIADSQIGARENAGGPASQRNQLRPRVLRLSAPAFDHDRRALKSESLPQLIDQEPLGGKVQMLSRGCKRHERGRPHRRLRHVVNLDVAIELQHLDEPVQFARRHALRSRFDRPSRSAGTSRFTPAPVFAETNAMGA